MKRIIELPDDVVKAIQNGEDYRYDIHTAIAQSIPYNPTGDLISRKVIKGLISDKSIPIKFEKEKRGGWHRSSGVLLSDIYNIINNAPTVETERPQGEWVNKEYRKFLPRDAEPDYNDDTYDEKTHSVIDTHIVCSECGAEKMFYHKFCGNCGASMKGGAE